jgi:hypothetical protein
LEFQYLRVSSTFEDGLARAPPATSLLTYEALAPILEEALQRWSASGLSPELASRLAKIQVSITDLPSGQLGYADGYFIPLDINASGYGWFIDQSPEDDAEFALALTEYRIAAGSDSAAYGRIDLLTALIHEVGHVVGFGHDADSPVMHEVLAVGERLPLLTASSSSEVGGNADPVIGALTSVGGRLAADAVTDIGALTFTIVDANGNGLADVSVSGAANPVENRLPDL